MRRYLGLILILALCLPLTAHAGTTLHDAVTANATGKNVSVADKGAVGVAVTITSTATVTFQGSTNNGATWNDIQCIALNGTAAVTSTTWTGQYVCPAAGITHFQAPVSGCAGCTVTVTANTSLASLQSNGVTLVTLLACEDQTNNLCMTSGGAVRSTTMASAVTTNTTSAAVALPVGSKSIYGSLTGTGAITQTQAIYGGITSGVTSTTGILLCTLTLTGTTAVYDACPVMTANFLFYIVVTTATTGTGASGTVTGMY